MSTDWNCIPRERDFKIHSLNSTITYEHPLKQATITVLESKGTRNVPLGSNPSSAGSSTLSLDPLSLASFDGSDPLSAFARQEAMDPLSQIANENEDAKSRRHAIVADDIEPWSVRRLAILNRYTTSEKLTIMTSFLTGGEMIKTQTTMSEKVKNRLEQLDDFEEGSIRQMMNLTQQEYMVKIEQLNHELVQAWHTDQRVKALKIAIQCSKLLVDTSVMQFYPSKFVLITDILDIFGKLVYDRLKNKAEYIEPGKPMAPTALPDNFTPDMVPEAAKETCMNWFYKIASIRELLPRFYVETAILKCYSFLTDKEFNAALLRLTKMIRGIGDPLVSIYARCYLCRVGMTVTSDRYYIRENLNDFLAVYHTLFNGTLRGEITRQRLDISAYLSLYTPALDWIMQAASAQAPDYLLEEILGKCQEKKNSGMLLISILNTFKPEFIAHRALKFANILSNCTTTGHTRGQLLRALGQSFNRCAPPDAQKLQVLSNTWRVIATLTDTDYIQCVEMWTQFVSENFGSREINTFLGDILGKMTPNRAYEHHLNELSSIIDKIFMHTKDVEAVLILDNFLSLLDLFQKDPIKVDVCKNILAKYQLNADPNINISDPVMVNALMYIGQVLSDSVNALTVPDECRQISKAISFFIRRVDYGRDFEQQLTFYVEARAAFPNLESVFATLVHCVNRLAFDTRRIVKAQHSRKTLAFVKGCAAYCFITIPSIVSVMTRMDLYLLSGQVALLNLCLGQADACFEAAIKCIAQLPKTVEVEGGKPKSTELFLVNYVAKFLSNLILVPDSPEQGVLYLLRLLLDVVKEYPFDTSNGSLCVIYCHILDMLSIAAQESYPYHIPNVISNDDLYGLDPKFISEINALCSQVTDLVLIQLKYFGVTHQNRLQGALTLDLFIRLIMSASLRSEKTFTLAVNLWHLALKNRQSMDAKVFKNAVETLNTMIRTSRNVEHSDRLCELLNRIKAKS